MPDVRLEGCRPEPLASYLKALGVLRIVAEQVDPEARGHWWHDIFVLSSSLDEEGLVQFFVEKYRPTPIVAPWNKDSGFYRKDTPIDIIASSADGRLSEFREVIAIARHLIKEFGWSDKPGGGDEKVAFVAVLRARLPERSVRWLDALVAVAGDATWAPAFVAGGVDGRFEFTRVYAESIVRICGLESGRRQKIRPSSEGLRAALFGVAEPAAKINATGGPLAPASVDAPNAAQGYVGRKQLNPWDFVLGMEGALHLSGAVSRRFGPVGSTRAAFPFTVDPAGAGYTSAGVEPSRGEIWVPLWERPMTARELSYLFREGRAEWRGRPATTATDMARAIVSLGVDRGLNEFRRFGVQGRSGRMHLAIPLGRWPVVDRPEAELLAKLDEFLSALRRATMRTDAPGALTESTRRLEAAILNYASYGGRDRLLEVLLATSRAELTLARRLARRPSTRPRGFPRPLPGLSRDWIAVCDDGSPEFELAASIASLRPAVRGPGEFRRHIEPVVRRGDSWAWAESTPHEVVWSGRNTLRDLAAVLERRLVDANREGVPLPVDGHLRVHPASVAALLEGEIDLERLGRLAEGLALVDWEGVGSRAGHVRPVIPRRQPEAPVPAAYAVLKLVFVGRPIHVGALDVAVRPDPSILRLLRAGDIWGAVTRATRRLRVAGLVVRGIPEEIIRSPAIPDHDLGRRLLAALIVPVLETPLVNAVLEVEEETMEEGASWAYLR